MNSVEASNSAMAGKRIQILLFAVSVLTLFIEIMLIRHLASEIRIFAYFKNLALIGAFLGLGFGYLYKTRIPPAITALCMALIALATHPYSGFTKISQYLSLGDLNTWSASKIQIPLVILGVFLLTLLFFLVILCMIPMGQVLAGIFDGSTNRIRDYSINILGSLAGVWLFTLISFLRIEPLAWYLLGAGGIIFLSRRAPRELAISIGAAAIILAAFLGRDIPNTETVWSPYQKITYRSQPVEYKDGDKTGMVEVHTISANSIFYLYILDLSLAQRRLHPAIFDEKYDNYLYYDAPYRFPQKLDEVLVLGSGGGNDVAAALRAGAGHVTAVEIDPVIIEYGKRLHPERPYQSPKVTIVNNDGRNYLRNTDKKFDLIILGLLDSHTLTSNFSNTNLDSFLYTQQSVADMRNRLNENGVLALSFWISKGWIGGKLFHMVGGRFGADPLVINYPFTKLKALQGAAGTYFISSNNPSALEARVREDNVLGELIQANQKYKEELKSIKAIPQTDDWPYLYVKDAAIPQLHKLVTFVLLAIFMVMAVKAFGAPSGSDLHFAGLGAGFLLMEVAVISRFCLFWGTTWIVSSIVISMILIAILTANLFYLIRGRGAPYPYIYGAIVISLLGVYLAPLSSWWMILLYMAPFVAIGLLFAQSFDNSKLPSHALAYNLFGSLVGGLSESVSFITGISALILVGLGFYLFSAIFAGAVRKG